MSKATTFVVVYSIFLIGLFITFAYLMADVEPKIINVGKAKSNESTSTKPDDKAEKASERLAAFFDRKRRSKGMMLDDSYFSRRTTNSAVSTSKSNDIMTNRTSQNVLESIENNNVTQNFTHSTAFRRSIDIKKSENKTDSIMVKIIDDDGYPVVEIKINNKKRKSKKSNKLKSSDFKIAVQNDGGGDEKIRSLLRSGISKLLPDADILIDQGNIDLFNAHTNVNDVSINEKIKDKLNAIDQLPIVTTARYSATTTVETNSLVKHSPDNTLFVTGEPLNKTKDILFINKGKNIVSDVNNNALLAKGNHYLPLRE